MNILPVFRRLDSQASVPYLRDSLVTEVPAGITVI